MSSTAAKLAREMSGLCRECGSPADDDRSRCKLHLVVNTEKSLDRYYRRRGLPKPLVHRTMRMGFT